MAKPRMFTEAVALRTIAILRGRVVALQGENRRLRVFNSSLAKKLRKAWKSLHDTSRTLAEASTLLTAKDKEPGCG